MGLERIYSGDIDLAELDGAELGVLRAQLEVWSPKNDGKLSWRGNVWTTVGATVQPISRPAQTTLRCEVGGKVGELTLVDPIETTLGFGTARRPSRIEGRGEPPF